MLASDVGAATGDFTEAEEPPPKPAPKQAPLKPADPQVTGDFTQAVDGNVGQATGDFTDADGDSPASPDETQASDADENFDIAEKPKPKKIKPKTDLLWAWLGFAVLAVGLGALLWFLTDRAEAKAQEDSLDRARALFRALRLAGLEEDALRQFVCKFSGTNWEPFFEAIFGYEAKLAARAFRKGNTGEVSKKDGTWREPVIGWLEARLESRRQAKERLFLQKVEAKSLEAEGVNKADAKAQAEAMAGDLVDQAKEAKTARKEGKEGNIVKAMFEKARQNKRPKPGYNLAGVKLQNTHRKDFLNEWFGRRLRFALGAVLFAAGLLWMNQNGLLKKENNLIEHIVNVDGNGAKKWFEADAARPLSIPLVPSMVTDRVNSFAVPVAGLLLMLAGACYFGWKSSVTAIPGAIIAVLGPMFIPVVGPLSAQMVSLAIGAVLIVGVSWLVRK